MKVVTHSCLPHTKKDTTPRRVERAMTAMEEADFNRDQNRIAAQHAQHDLAEKRIAALQALSERVLSQALADPDAPQAVKEYAVALNARQKGGSA